MLFLKRTDIKRPPFRRVINFFIGIGIGLVLFLLLAFGFTQTSSFRNWLKEFIVEKVNSSTNGKLSIENIDGTIFTSLILTNTNYTLEEDTILSAGRIEVKFSPLRIFLKTIYFRKLEIENANISLLKNENGELNISRIIPPSEEEEIRDTVTTSEPFSWKIDVADLKLKNINFKHQSYTRRNSRSYYPQPDMDDFRVEDVNLSLSAVANAASNEYELYVSQFSAKPNLNGFNLINLSGNFILLNDIAGVKDLRIITDRSDISVNAAISDFSPFSKEGINLENSPIKLNLRANDFNFDDLTNFIEGTDLLKGSVETHLSASGTLNDLQITNLEIKFNETRLNAEVWLKNILGGTDMLINATFRDSYVNQDNVKDLLPTINIPTYYAYGVLQFDSLYFDGKPLDFNAGLLLRTDKGKIDGIVEMDLTGEEIVYNYQIKTYDLNLEPVTGVRTNLNSNGILQGKGFSPENLETSIQLSAIRSTIGEISFSEFKIDANGADGMITTDVSFKSLETLGRINSKFDFTDSANVNYSFDLAVNGFNISDYMKEGGLTSELNIKLTGDGQNFGQDNLNLFAVLEIDSSNINEIGIDSTTLIADIRSSEDNRIVNIISDLADLTVTGKFSVLEITNVIAEEVNLISSSIQKKIEQIRPPDFTKSESFSETQDVVNLSSELNTRRNLDVQYLLELKSFELISLFLGNADIEIDGEITGKLFAAGDTTILSLDTKINELTYWDGLELYYLSDFDFIMNINNRLSYNSFEDFFADVKIDASRIFVGSEIEDLSFNLDFRGNNAEVELSALYENYIKLELAGLLSINDGYVEVLLDDLLFKYYNFELENSNDIKFSYSNDNFIFNSFTLVHNGGKLDLSGQLSFTGNENIALKLSNFALRDLSTELLKLPPERTFEGNLNLDFTMAGTAESPLINLSYYIDSVKVQNYYLGSIQSTAQYSDKLLSVDLSFLDIKNNQSRKSLGFGGTLPIDLSFYSKERFSKKDDVDLTFFADDFDLRFAGGLLPGVQNMKGVLNGTIGFSGSYHDIKNNGNLSVDNSSFILKAVNLTYLLEADLVFDKNRIVLSNLTLSNESNIKGGGTMNISGELVHQNFAIDELNLKASGSLKLFDQRSKAVDPSLYGDIAIKTRDDIRFTLSEDKSYLFADLILKDGASITYSPTQSAFTNESDKFTYIFTEVSSEDIKVKEIDSLIQVSELKKEEMKEELEIPFDLNLKIEVEKEAKVVFVLSREFKQNLTAYLGGKLEYSVTNDVPVTRGELTLLDGSKLDFIKTFQAEGNIRFLDKLDNPYVNVIATYESYYSPDTLRTGANEYDVQVRIKLEGPAESITTDFLQNENNIEVYKKRRGYNQYELDATKTASDAMFFIIVNKFPEDASLQESNFAASTAASLAGSIVGTVLNESLGDVVRSVNVQQYGSETKFSLIGKVEEFRYEIGGTSQVFQDLSRANVKIERSIFFPNLIIRFDRREPTYQSATYSEMINELGLKYSFIF